MSASPRKMENNAFGCSRLRGVEVRNLPSLYVPDVLGYLSDPESFSCRLIIDGIQASTSYYVRHVLLGDLMEAELRTDWVLDSIVRTAMIGALEKRRGALQLQAFHRRRRDAYISDRIPSEILITRLLSRSPSTVRVRLLLLGLHFCATSFLVSPLRSSSPLSKVPTF